MPEYDLESDELIYRDTAGNEVSREKLNELDAGAALRAAPHPHPVSKNASPLGRIIYPFQENRRSPRCIDEAFRNVL